MEEMLLFVKMDGLTLVTVQLWQHSIQHEGEYISVDTSGKPYIGEYLADVTLEFVKKADDADLNVLLWYQSSWTTIKTIILRHSEYFS